MSPGGLGSCISLFMIPPVQMLTQDVQRTMHDNGQKKPNKITLKKQNPQLAIGRRGYLDDNLISNIALYMVTVHKTLTL